ncbi:MAG: holo-[acyl-carrier-protein] synthase AcpS [Pseudomonadota bacterium]|jgi:holo-[acyl-carrier protein] synthase
MPELPTPPGTPPPRPGARIYGIGTDVCDIRRIAATLGRRGERFPERVLGQAELQVWRARSARTASRGLAYLATRFSAKEAFSKAIGLGLHAPMSWRACEILNHASGQPYVRLHGVLADWCAARGLVAHVTLSDETDTAVSFVVVEQHAPAAPAQAAAAPSHPPPDTP